MEGYRLNEKTLLRFGEEADLPLILELIRDLAEYVGLVDQMAANEGDLRHWVFQEKKAEVLIVEYEGRPAGFCLFFHNFSTFLGKPGIYIEDLFVKPAFRGKGLGKALLSFAAKLALDRDCGRLEWACLDRNEASVAFYKSQGARPLSEWTTYRITGEGLQRMAAGAK
jgi:GNAT superfamily N-acetyltransferase